MTSGSSCPAFSFRRIACLNNVREWKETQPGLMIKNSRLAEMASGPPRTMGCLGSEGKGWGEGVQLILKSRRPEFTISLQFRKE